MNIEQEARDKLADVIGCDWGGGETRENSPIIEAVCRAIEARDETQAAFDAYRREVSEKVNGALFDFVTIATLLRAFDGQDCAAGYAHGRAIMAQVPLADLNLPAPIDPLTATLDELGVNRADFDAALAKIGGKVVFEGEGA